MSTYREPGRELLEPAPYLHPGHECPLCGGNPWLLYFHDQDCPWWLRYLGAGKRMRMGLGVVEQSGYSDETADERAAVMALGAPVGVIRKVAMEREARALDRARQARHATTTVFVAIFVGIAITLLGWVVHR